MEGDTVESELPNVVCVSCTSKSASDIVKLIVTETEFEKPSTLEDGIDAYPWFVDTKYYTANLEVCAVHHIKSGSDCFTQRVGGVVVYFDSSKDEGLEEIEPWMPPLSKWKPEVQLLLCETCQEDPKKGTSRRKAQEWCIARHFELVELNPEKDEGWEDDEDYVEPFGIDRVKQALHAHRWSTMRLKGRGDDCSHKLRPQPVPQVPLIVSVDSNGVTNNQEGDDGLSEELRSLRLKEEALQNGEVLDDLPAALGSGETTDDFFKLFQNLAEMKERVSGMSTDDRKACAEQVVKAFWEAMGGDSDELSDGDEAS